VPVLKYLEKVIRPRWPTPIEATKRLGGTIVVILSATLVFIPIPLSNVVPALVIALIPLAYLEEDGILLSIVMLAAVIVVTVVLVAVWETVLGAERIIRLTSWPLIFCSQPASRFHVTTVPTGRPRL
jgi:hypothetical protein